MITGPTLLAALLLQVPQQADSAVYRNDANGFRITVPARWALVPDSILRAQVQRLRRAGAPEQETNYPAAFARLPMRDWFAFPYVLIQVNEHHSDDPVPALERIAADLNALGRSAARVATGGDAVLVAGLRVPGPAGAWIRSFSGIRRSRRALVSVMVYALEPDSTDAAAIRDQFLSALQVESKP
jgi:hypothetical protein